MICRPIFLIGLIALGAVHAAAQITSSGSTQLSVSDSANALSQSAPYTATFADDTLSVSGSGSYATQPGINGNTQSGNSFEIKASQTFTVGEHPVQISPKFTPQFNLVNTGGTASAPVTVAAYSAELFESDPGSAEILHADDSTTLNGAGLKQASGSPTFSTATYALASGVSYEIDIDVTVTIDASSLGTSDPSSTVSLGRGGGPDLSVALNPLSLPEPIGLPLMGGSTILLASRRRRHPTKTS